MNRINLGLLVAPSDPGKKNNLLFKISLIWIVNYLIVSSCRKRNRTLWPTLKRISGRSPGPRA